MEMPSLSRLGTIASSIVSGGFLGIDLGTSSVKIVQLSMEAGVPVLQTYGEIELGPYAEREARRSVHASPQQHAAALQDLMHDIEASARSAGLCISLSNALISLIQTPKRDNEQMKKLITSDAQSYIPVPIESVEVDWLVVGEENPRGDAFTRAESKEPARPRMQDVMIVAIGKETIASYTTVAETAGISAAFYELDIFSVARACAHAETGPVLFLDLGASSVKMSVINSHGLPLAAHAIEGGGEKITESIMKACDWNFEKAETAKREHGFGNSASYTHEQSVSITNAIRQEFDPILSEASRFATETANRRDIDIAHVQLLGGGALMPGVAEYAAHSLNKTVTLIDPFAALRVPMILEDVVKEVGPKFATVVGAALRGIRR